ncbi:MAG: hypothetical protein ACRERU_08205 [Methylococcales bacterium]
MAVPLGQWYVQLQYYPPGGYHITKVTENGFDITNQVLFGGLFYHSVMFTRNFVFELRSLIGNLEFQSPEFLPFGVAPIFSLTGHDQGQLPEAHDRSFSADFVSRSRMVLIRAIRWR